MSAGPWDSLIVGAGAEAVRIRRMDALDFYGRGTVAVQPGAQVEVVLRSDYLTALAQRDAARDIAVRLEGELARVESVVRASMASDDLCDAFLAVDFIFHILAASKYVTDPTYPVMHLASLTVDEVAAEFARFRANASGIQVLPDAVIAEGES